MPSRIRRTKPLSIWLLPREIDALNNLAVTIDSDRSKIIRKAIREELKRHSVNIFPTEILTAGGAK